MWYFYIVRCADESLYSGATTDIKRRIKEHNAGKGGGYTNAHRPVKLVYKEVYRTQSRALTREYQIKKWTRKKKLKLITTKIP